MFNGSGAGAERSGENGILELPTQALVLTFGRVLSEPGGELWEANLVADLLSGVDTGHEPVGGHQAPLLLLPDIPVEHVSDYQPLNPLCEGSELRRSHLVLAARSKEILLDHQRYQIAIHKEAIVSF